MPTASSSVSKTPRNRRKQRSCLSSKSSTEVNDNFDDKENWTLKTSHTNQKLTTAKKIDKQPKHNGKSLMKSSLRDLLHQCVPDISNVEGFWNDNSGLLEWIADASLSENEPTFALHLSLEENKSQLLGGSRRLIKEATSIRKGDVEVKHSSSFFGCLFVACHALRCLRPWSDGFLDIKDIETAIRLLHHLLQITADATNSGSSDLRLLAILISSYDAISHFIRQYSCTFPSKDGTVRFEYVSDERMVVPRWNETKGTDTVGTMTLRQVSSIYIKAIQASTVAIGHLWHASGRQQSDDFFNVCSIAPLCGKLCSLVVTGLDKTTKMDLLASEQLSPEVLRHAYMRWTLCLLDSNDQECTKDALSHCKSGHKILWDLASKMKSSHLSETEKNQASLDLRMHATLLMLPCSEAQNKVALVNFNAACSYAWKAASVYAQALGSTIQSCDSKSVLSTYHNKVGKALDCNVLKISNSRMPLSYLEYSAHRILHANILPPIDLVGQNKSIGPFFQAFLNIIVLMAKVRNQLEGENVETKYLESYEEERISSLGKTIVEGLNALEPEEFSRTGKLLTMFSLHRSIYIATRREHSSRDEQCLRVAGIISTKCIAPYLSLLLEKEPGSSNAHQLIETIVECYIRPLSAFEKLSNEYFQQDNDDLEGTFARLSDATVKELHGFVSRTRHIWPSLSLLTKCAKSLSIVGRQRVENSRNGSSIIPLLHSIALYRDASTEIWDDNEHQLLSRLNQLSNVYQKMGRHEECCLVLASIISIESARNHHKTKSKSPEMDCVDLLASRSKSVIPRLEKYDEMTVLLRSAIKRLIFLFPSPALDSETEPKCTESYLDLDRILDILLEGERTKDSVFQMVAGSLGEQVSLTSLLYAALQPDIMTAKREMFSHHLMTLVEFIEQLGGQISHLASKHPEEDVAYLLSNHNDLVKCAEYVVTQHFRGSSLVRSILTSLLNLVCSTSLLPMRNFVEETIHGASFKELNVAVMERILHLANESLLSIRTVGSSETAGGWDAIGEAILLAASQYSAFLKSAESPKEYPSADMMQLFSLCESSVERVLESNSARPETKKWIIWSLLNMKSRLDVEGDHIRATRLALLSLALADKSDVAEMEWFSSIFAESYQKIPILHRNVALSVKREWWESAAWTRQEPLDQLASHAFRLSLSMLDRCIDDSINNDEVTNIRNSEDHAKVSFFPEWVLSSSAKAQAQLAHQSGNLVLALKQIQVCTTHCQRVLIETRHLSPVDDVELPFWFRVARMTLSVQASQRYAECLLTKSQLLIQLGDHRKAWSCVLSVPRILGADIEIQTTCDRTRMLQSTISSLMSSKRLILRQFNRFRLAVNCLFSPGDLVVTEFKHTSPDKLTYGNEESMNEAIHDLISAGDILYASEMTTHQPCDFKAYYESLSQYQLSPLAIIRPNLELPEATVVTPSHAYRSKVNLLKARSLFHSASEMDETILKTIESLCLDVINDPTSSPIDKSWANYYVGLLALNTLQKNGDLARLWQGQEVLASKPLALARESFLSAISGIDDNDNNFFYRTLIRSLALVSGPESRNLSGSASGVLVLTSIGSVGRRQMLKTLDGKQGADDIMKAFSCFDTRIGDKSERDRAIYDFFSRLEAVTPKNWHFVAAAICTTGELLLTSLYKGADDGTFRVETRCVFPDNENYSAYDDILRPLDEIIGKSQQHLQGMNPDQVMTNYTKEAAKRDWWNLRNKLDEALCHHIHQAEETYFSTIHLVGNSGGSIFDESDTECLPCGNLASRFEAACEPDASEVVDEIDEESLWTLTVPKLKDILRHYRFSDPQMRRMRKHELIEKIIELQGQNKLEGVGNSSNAGSRSCLFLLLDENLQRFPFEGMDSLQGKQVYRIPSLPFVYATLQERMKPGSQCISLDPSSTTFVLDPEGNLESTRKRLLPVLEEVSSSRGWDWDGVAGRLPTSSFFESALMKEHGLVIFIGHGGAQACYSRRDVEQLISGESSKTFRTCKASLILMGCSSGRLVSINQKGTKSFEEQPLFFDPEGIALSYLCAGAPCVVGNLWDVTDHDIDRFSIALFQKFFREHQSDEIESLGHCVATSRSSCKLRYIVGCAPVCYGVPVFCA